MSLTKALSSCIQNCFSNNESSRQRLLTFTYCHFHFDKSISESITSQFKHNSFQNLKLTNGLLLKAILFINIVESKVMVI